MIPLTLADVASVIGGRLVDVAPDVVVHAVTTDSRSVPPGALFVALPGEVHDGHDHAAAAMAAGAIAAVSSRELAEPHVRVSDTWRALADLAAHVRDTVAPHVVGVTGSVGKTTTKDLLAAAFGSQRRTHAAVGSYNNEAGVPLTLLGLQADTEVLIAELGARGRGHVADLAAYVRPDVAVVTAVAGVHLELFGELMDVAAAKGELVEALTPDGVAVLNADDARVAAMAARTAGRVVRVSAAGDSGADVRAEDVELDALARPRFTAVTPWGRADVHLPIAGRHQVGNALLALAAAGASGLALSPAAAALATASVSGWRGEVSALGGVTLLNDAYNANPTSVVAALDTLVALGGRAIAVLGVMAEIGPTHAEEHARVGAHAAACGVGRLVVVGSGADAIADGAAAAGLPHDRIVRVPDAEAALTALADVAPGDAVLVKASRVAGLERVALGLAALLRSEATP